MNTVPTETAIESREMDLFFEVEADDPTGIFPGKYHVSTSTEGEIEKDYRSAHRLFRERGISLNYEPTGSVEYDGAFFDFNFLPKQSQRDFLTLPEIKDFALGGFVSEIPESSFLKIFDGAKSAGIVSEFVCHRIESAIKNLPGEMVCRSAKITMALTISSAIIRLTSVGAIS